MDKNRLAAEIRFEIDQLRHLAITVNGFEIDWEKVYEPLCLLPETVELLSSLWLRWLDDTCH